MAVAAVDDSFCHGDLSGYRRVLERVDFYDDFLREMIGAGFVVPKEYRKNPSILTEKQLRELIDQEFKPLTLGHRNLLQLLELRREEWVKRERVKIPEEIAPSNVITDWNEDNSENFKSWYLDHYFFKVKSPLDERQISYARGLCKYFGIIF